MTVVTEPIAANRQILTEESFPLYKFFGNSALFSPDKKNDDIINNELSASIF